MLSETYWDEETKSIKDRLVMRSEFLEHYCYLTFPKAKEAKYKRQDLMLMGNRQLRTLCLENGLNFAETEKYLMISFLLTL